MMMKLLKLVLFWRANTTTLDGNNKKSLHLATIFATIIIIPITACFQAEKTTSTTSNIHFVATFSYPLAEEDDFYEYKYNVTTHLLSSANSTIITSSQCQQHLPPLPFLSLHTHFLSLSLSLFFVCCQHASVLLLLCSVRVTRDMARHPGSRRVFYLSHAFEQCLSPPNTEREDKTETERQRKRQREAGVGGGVKVCFVCGGRQRRRQIDR